MITESQIKAAHRRLAESDKKSITLKDDGSRGTGRMALILRKLGRAPKERVIAEWYAIAYRAGDKQMVKLGTYPAMALAAARKEFGDRYAPAIAAGAELPAGPHARAGTTEPVDRPATVKALFDAYADTLAGKSCHRGVKRNLELAADRIGPDKLASQVTPGDITGHLADIYARGSRAQARNVRVQIGSAFNFGLRSAFDYKNPNAISQWNLTSNPVAAIATDHDAVKPGDRFLTPDEFRTVWLWMESKAEVSRLATVIRLNMACGQRWVEMLALSDTIYDRSEQMLYWPTTKNGRPHSVPLPAVAVRILADMPTNAHGLFFPHFIRPAESATQMGVLDMVYHFLEKNPGFRPFTPRDIRRTWKTLTGQAGISREVRDKLQNHAQTDVGSKHYDRYDYLPERRQAMMKWNAFLERMIAGELRQVA